MPRAYTTRVRHGESTSAGRSDWTPASNVAMLVPMRGHEPARHQGKHMLGKVGRVVAGLLVGWFVFVFVAMGLAFLKRRDAVPQDPDADELDLVATFGPLDFASTATAFRGGRVETWFGGGVLDLRNATLDPMGATIEVNALFGGGNLLVPEDWNVETHVVGIGGAGDGRPHQERLPDAPTLRLEGFAMFGGWGVSSTRNDEPSADALAPV